MERKVAKIILHFYSPGEPDADYPIYNTVPETSFSCADHGDGIYADPEARCQAWHQGGKKNLSLNLVYNFLFQSSLWL